MLRITISRSSALATNYFKEALSKEGSYYAGNEISAVWKGNGAKELGLENKKVTEKAFSNLANNRHPDSQERITVRDANNRRAGFDFTFNASKSISVLYAITKDPDILEAHQNAYRAAMKEIEAHAQVQANSRNERIYKNSNSIIYSAFDHFTSRPNEIKLPNGQKDYISDPHLHTHSYVMNMSYNSDKKRFEALETGNIFRQAKYFESYYHSFLSHQLNQLGYQIQRTHERYEVAQISRDIIDRYSNRTKFIEALAKEKNITDPRAKAQLGAISRNSKAKNKLKEEDLYKHWKDRLSPAEFKHLQSVKGKKTKDIDKISPDEAIQLSLSHNLERQSAAKESDIMATALSYSYGQHLPEDIKAALHKRKDVLRSEDHTVNYLTTKALVRDENNLIEKSVAGKGTLPPLNPSYQIKAQFLNDQQINAVQTLLKSNDRINILQGAAGSGKSTLLSELASGIREAGKSVMAVAPSTAARDILRKEGFKAETISALLHNKTLQNQLKDVLFVDESSLLGVRTANQLVELTEQRKSRLIMSGDTFQHHSVEAGDAHRCLRDKAKIKTVTVNKILRQKVEPFRKVVEQMAKGKSLEAFQALDKMGSIKEIADNDERLLHIAKDYVSKSSKKESTLIISPSKAEGEILTHTVRALQKQKGIIKGKERSFETLNDLSFTQAQKKDQSQYQEGQVVRYFKNQGGGFKAGSQHEILPKSKDNKILVQDLQTKDVRELPLSQSEYYTIFQKTKMNLAEGDLIKASINSRYLEGGKVANGTFFRIEGFTKSNDVKLDNGKTLSKDFRHMRHAVVDTSYGAQGKTVKHVIVAQSELSYPASSKEQLYVSISRGTHSATIYTSDKSELKKAITKGGERISAREISDSHHRRMQQQRTHHKTLNEKLKEHGRKQRQKSTSRNISKSWDYGRER